MPIYNKLVRDRIPEIIKKTGKKFTTTILSEEEYFSELKRKLQEELNEYVSTKSDEEGLEELADIMELINALAIYHGSSLEEIEKIRIKKAEKRGGFQEKIYLVEVEDD